MLHSRPRCGGKEFTYGRTEEEIAHGVTRDERIMPPRPSDFELQACTQITGVQILFREWPGFMNGRAAHGNPVEEGRGVQVQELAKELLVHVERRIGVAADSELQTGIEHDMRIAHAQYRLH